MPETLLPLFPLPLVLFPSTPLPLHIFEERYKLMIGQCIEDRTEFGIVQATERGIANTGCTATIERILKRYPDGRLDILTIGRRRFEILRLNDELDYLRGAVDYYDDVDPEEPPAELRSLALERYQQLRRLDEDAEEISADDEHNAYFSFRLAQPVQDLQFRQVLLSLKSEAARLRQFIEYVPGYIARQLQIAHVKEVAPRNGHSTWPSNL